MKKPVFLLIMIYVDEENDLVIVSRWISNDKKADLVRLVLESLPE